jgi:hypothetical protein
MGKFVTKRRLKLGLLILGILTLGSVVVLVIKNMNGPAQGTVAYQNPNQPAIKPTQTTPSKYDGKFISFNYPTHYKIVPSQKSAGYLEVISLNSTDHSGKYVSVGILRETLTNDSGLNHRKAHPELYKLTSSTPNKVVFVGTGNEAEQTGFVAHNGLVATVSLTAISHKDLNEDFNIIVNSLHWKQ